jgi:hypothetical protein
MFTERPQRRARDDTKMVGVPVERGARRHVAAARDAATAHLQHSSTLRNQGLPTVTQYSRLLGDPRNVTSFGLTFELKSIYGKRKSYVLPPTRVCAHGLSAAPSALISRTRALL